MVALAKDDPLDGEGSLQSQLYRFFSALPVGEQRQISTVKASSLRSSAYNYNRSPLNHRISVRCFKDGSVAIEKVARQ